jgi:hypothetical protein
MSIKVMPQFLRHAPLPENPIEATFTKENEFSLEGEVYTVKSQVAMIVKELKKPVTPKEIFDAGIGTNTSVYEALKDLVKEKKITKVGRGEYLWVDKMPTDMV